MRHACLLPVLASALLVAAPAAAQTSEAPAAPPPSTGDFGDSITVGVAVAAVPEYEGSDKYDIVPAPAAIGTVAGLPFQLLGNRLSVDLIPNASGPGIDFQLGPIAVLNLNRTSTRGLRDDRVAALGELDTGIEVGAYVGLGKVGVITSDYDRLSVSVSYRQDVNGASKGAVWQPSVSYLTPLSTKTAVGLFFTADHADDDYADYYFSVNAAQAAASGLPAFQARSGWKSYTVGALGTISLTGDLLHGFKLVAGGTYKRMLNDFGDTPLTSIAGDRNQWLGAVGLAYTF